MKKVKALNNKGFVLVETLVVAVAVSAIFSLIFRHFYPLMGEYERRENFDDIDSKYGAYWFKRILQSGLYDFNSTDTTNLTNNGYTLFSCDKVSDEITKNMCYKLLVDLEVSCDVTSTKSQIENCSDKSKAPHIYITNYNLTTFKAKVESISGVTSGLIDYTNYLPAYSKVGSLNGAEHRIIIEYYRHRFDTENYNDKAELYVVDDDNDFLSYSTIEVKLP